MDDQGMASVGVLRIPDGGGECALRFARDAAVFTGGAGFIDEDEVSLAHSIRAALQPAGTTRIGVRWLCAGGDVDHKRQHQQQDQRPSYSF